MLENLAEQGDGLVGGERACVRRELAAQSLPDVRAVGRETRIDGQDGVRQTGAEVVLAEFLDEVPAARLDMGTHRVQLALAGEPERDLSGLDARGQAGGTEHDGEEDRVEAVAAPVECAGSRPGRERRRACRSSRAR